MSTIMAYPEENHWAKRIVEGARIKSLFLANVVLAALVADADEYEMIRPVVKTLRELYPVSEDLQVVRRGV